MHIALARKYRPRAFRDLVGQEHVARALRGAIEQNRVAHGYLLCGPRGVGKTTVARVLAMALNCETRHGGTATGGEPCGSCASCERIWSGGASLDVVEMDAASNRGVDDARDLRERAMYAASQEGRHKVYIVDEAHMLTREAWNTLLKVLEEPPPGVVFVFATTEPHKITNNAAPVMSRLQRFDFRRVGPQAIATRLGEVAAAERLALDPDAVELIARIADGGLRDALSILDQIVAFGDANVSAARVREALGLVGDEVFAELFRIVVAHDGAAVFPFVARLVEAGVDLIQFAQGAADLWRAALSARLGGSPEGISSGLAAAIAPHLTDLGAGDYLRILRTIEDAEEAVRRGSAPRITVETLLVRWALLDRTVDLAELLAGGSLAAPAPAAAPRATVAPMGRPAGRVAEQGHAVESPTRPSFTTAERPALRQTMAAPFAAPEVLEPEVLRRSAPSTSGELDLTAARRGWPGILDQLRADKKPLVATALESAAVVRVVGDALVVDTAGHEMGAESLTRNRQLIAAAASKVLGTQVRIFAVTEDVPEPVRSGASAAATAAVTAAPVPSSAAPVSPPSPPPAEPPAAGRSQRITVKGAQAERAKALRGKDPALDAAVDALDLELLD